MLNSGIRRVRPVGRVTEMENAAQAEGLKGIVGIGTAGRPGGVTEPNAHPRVSANRSRWCTTYREHEGTAPRRWATFESQTDTEVVAHLIHHTRRRPTSSGHAQVADLRGAYALGAVSLGSRHHGRGALGCPRHGVGRGGGLSRVDFSALASRRGVITSRTATPWRSPARASRSSTATAQVERKVHLSELSADAVDLGPYQHYMQKGSTSSRALPDTRGA